MSVILGKKILARPNKDIYISKNGKLLVKVFHHQSVSASEVLGEAMNQALVEEATDLLIPKLVEVYKKGKDWCIAYQYIEGTTLEEMMKKDPSADQKHIEDLLDLQLKMAGHKVPKLPSLVNKLQSRISESKDIIPATTRYELHLRLDAVPKHEKLVHGDFVPSNIIYTPDGKVYILDWAHAARGNGSADCCYTYLNLVLEGKEDLAKYYLNLFCTKTDTAYQYVTRWLPIIAAVMAKKETGERRKKLLSMTDVVEYM